MQVALVDLNQSVGEECKSDLDGQFGEDNCVFMQCDVTDAGKLRGKTFFLFFYKFEKYVLERNNYPLYIAHL